MDFFLGVKQRVIISPIHAKKAYRKAKATTEIIMPVKNPGVIEAAMKMMAASQRIIAIMVYCFLVFYLVVHVWRLCSRVDRKECNILLVVGWSSSLVETWNSL